MAHHPSGSLPTPPPDDASSALDEEHLYIVIPAYNEGTRLGKVLEQLIPMRANIVVVDDGSSDNTAEIAAAYPVHVLRHVINRGQGAALQTGITYSLRQGAEYLVTYDADGQHQHTDIARMLTPVKEQQCDVALGSRFLDDRSNVPLARRCLLQAARTFTRWTSGLNLTDCHNGFRVLSRRAAAAIQIRQDGMAHASEIYDQIVTRHLAYREVPVQIHYSADTLEKGQSGSNAIRIAFHYLMGKLAT
ncbi:MAG: glycosyltransferase family 2 protein [Planctomycetales bacterium]|nr:glycosyltransferase family 2 protein [Planctomycetales bacterium]